MIKFFRKIRYNLMETGKTAKYFKYAIGEIFLVVIGILIALQINNWNEHKKERLEEQKILNAIYAGFKFSKLEVKQNIEETSRASKNSKKVLQTFNYSDTLSHEQSDNLITEMYSFSTFHPSDGALNDLINSGRLNIIKNETLKDKLSNWNSVVLDVTEDETYLRNFIDKYIQPVRLETLSLNKDSKFKRQSLQLFNDPQFENITHQYLRMTEYQVKLYKQLDTEIDLILKLLSQEIK